MHICDLGNPQFQEKLKCSNCKTKPYEELADEFAKAEFAGHQTKL